MNSVMPVKILIVEDEILIAMGIELELKQYGYADCDRVTTGEAAISVASKNPPDIILMDINLAGHINGIEAARHIQSKNKIPIIFITGYQDKTMEEQITKLQPAGYFVKPLIMQKIKTLIDKLQPYN